MSRPQKVKIQDLTPMGDIGSIIGWARSLRLPESQPPRRATAD
jgi:hypothetical protein